jgi:hypothetical protein
MPGIGRHPAGGLVSGGEGEKDLGARAPSPVGDALPRGNNPHQTFGLVAGPGNTDVVVRKAEELSQKLPVIKALISKYAEVRCDVFLNGG